MLRKEITMCFVERALIEVYLEDMERKKKATWALQTIKCPWGERDVLVQVAKDISETGVAYWVYIVGYHYFRQLNEFAGVSKSKAGIHDQIDFHINEFIRALPQEAKDELEKRIRASFFSARGLLRT